MPPCMGTEQRGSIFALMQVNKGYREGTRSCCVAALCITMLLALCDLAWHALRHDVQQALGDLAHLAPYDTPRHALCDAIFVVGTL